MLVLIVDAMREVVPADAAAVAGNGAVCALGRMPPMPPPSGTLRKRKRCMVASTLLSPLSTADELQLCCVCAESGGAGEGAARIGQQTGVGLQNAAQLISNDTHDDGSDLFPGATCEPDSSSSVDNDSVGRVSTKKALFSFLRQNEPSLGRAWHSLTSLLHG